MNECREGVRGLLRVAISLFPTERRDDCAIGAERVGCPINPHELFVTDGILCKKRPIPR